jgi:crotonobetainyl-CoA:carnitine CoA-transferase CaiB-like acyl-CoA transferase
VDTALVEPLLTLLGPQLTAYDLLGELQPRTGNRSSHNAPRNLYRTADGSWVAVSSSATSIAARVLRLVGRGDLAEQPWFGTGSGRVEHVDEIDDAVAAWIGERTGRRCWPRSRTAGAAIAPSTTPSDVLADPQLEALGCDQHRRGPAARPAADAERDQPALRDARADPPPAGATAPTRRRLRRARRQGGRARDAARRRGRMTASRR